MPQGSELMAVVKANAYGHGDYEISTHLEKNGVKAFAVATIEEGIRGMILILGYTDIHRAKELKQYAHLKQLSYGLLNYPELRCDYVRVGHSIWG